MIMWYNLKFYPYFFHSRPTYDRITYFIIVNVSCKRVIIGFTAMVSFFHTFIVGPIN